MFAILYMCIYLAHRYHPARFGSREDFVSLSLSNLSVNLKVVPFESLVSVVFWHHSVLSQVGADTKQSRHALYHVWGCIIAQLAMTAALQDGKEASKKWPPLAAAAEAVHRAGGEAGVRINMLGALIRIWLIPRT